MQFLIAGTTVIEYQFDRLQECRPKTNFSTAQCTAPQSGMPPSAATWPSPIAELSEIADGRNHVFAEAAGITAGSWYAWPSTHVGYELVAAGMLIMAGGHEVSRWILKRWSVGRASGSSGG